MVGPAPANCYPVHVPRSHVVLGLLMGCALTSTILCRPLCMGCVHWLRVCVCDKARKAGLRLRVHLAYSSSQHCNALNGAATGSAAPSGGHLVCGLPYHSSSPTWEVCPWQSLARSAVGGPPWCTLLMPAPRYLGMALHHLAGAWQLHWPRAVCPSQVQCGSCSGHPPDPLCRPACSAAAMSQHEQCSWAGLGSGIGSGFGWCLNAALS